MRPFVGSIPTARPSASWPSEVRSEPSPENPWSGSPFASRRTTRNSPSDVPATTILPSDWIATSAPSLEPPTRSTWSPSSLNVVSGVPFAFSRTIASPWTESAARTLVPTTTILPFPMATALAVSMRSLPEEKCAMPSPLKEWSGVPSGLRRTIAKCPAATPTATALPSGWRATSAAPPETPTRALPSPENDGSRSPGAASAGTAVASRTTTASDAVSAMRRGSGRARRRGTMEPPSISGGPDARSARRSGQGAAGDADSVERRHVLQARPGRLRGARARRTVPPVLLHPTGGAGPGRFVDGNPERPHHLLVGDGEPQPLAVMRHQDHGHGLLHRPRFDVGLDARAGPGELLHGLHVDVAGTNLAGTLAEQPTPGFLRLPEPFVVARPHRLGPLGPLGPGSAQIRASLHERGIDDHVDAGGDARVERPLQRRSDLVRLLHALPVAAEPFDHLLV